ncbi:MAG: hypothetical protein ACYTHN_19585 [Planctomycetota bacterium]
MVSRIEEDRIRFEREKAEREAAWEERRRARLKRHTVSGAVLFIIFHTLIGFILTGSILATLIGAILMGGVGAAAGFVISWRNLDRFSSAFVGIAFFAVFALLLSAVFGTLEKVNLGMLLAMSCIGGGIPGIFIGFHVETDHS